MSYQETKLWRDTLGQTGSADIERLRVAFTNLRAKSALICSSIAADLAHFTVHDITHLDALWEMGSELCGESVTINPLEAFVLGGAFLLHDAGLTIAAYPGGVREIVATPEWRETLSSVVRQHHKRPPVDGDLQHPDHETMRQALKVFLRAQHARRAERLACQAYPDPTSRAPIYLIEDSELRDTLGPPIGEIAASHWWDLSEVARRFGQGGDLGVPAQLQGGAHWTVDRLKLACLLRGADAIHLDARRAPALAHAIRFPHGEENAHWEFQKHVLKPYVRDRRIVFTSPHRFPASEATAWWQGYELLANADRELEGVESLLVDLKKDYRLAASGVLGAKDPSRLAVHVPTQDWFPVDATVHVSNVGSLVKSIGGYELYGEHYYIPLRELLQNASDAIRARRYLSAMHTPVREVYTGRAVIVVDTGKDGTKLTVRDNGVGMSLQTLSKELLDFGNSLWASDRLAVEFPRLLGTGFAATGRYGIGFFSSFMWASRVQVTTRKFSEGERTYVLEFLAGATRRPLVREPTEDERLMSGGTEITLWIDDPFVRGLLADGEKVAELCRWLCPAIDFDLLIAHDDGERLIVSASDWLNLESRDLIARVLPQGATLRRDKSIDYMAANITEITDQAGGVVGRASILDGRPYNDGTLSAATGVLTIGGFRATGLRGVSGIVAGEPVTASRLSGRPVAALSELSRWATAQAQSLMMSGFSDETLNASAAVVKEWGGDVLELPLATSAHGWLRKQDTEKWKMFPESVSVHPIAMMDSMGQLDGAGDHDQEESGIGPGVLFSAIGQKVHFVPFSVETTVQGLARTLVLDLVNCLARAWDVPTGTVIEESQFNLAEAGFSYDRNGDPMIMYYAPTIDIRKQKPDKR